MSKLTVTLPDDLHQQIRLELERQGITTAQFIELAVHNFFEQQKEGVHMATRTMAFQVSEELFQRIKEYLARFEQPRQLQDQRRKQRLALEKPRHRRQVGAGLSDLCRGCSVCRSRETAV